MILDNTSPQGFVLTSGINIVASSATSLSSMLYRLLSVPILRTCFAAMTSVPVCITCDTACRASFCDLLTNPSTESHSLLSKRFRSVHDLHAPAINHHQLSCVGPQHFLLMQLTSNSLYSSIQTLCEHHHLLRTSYHPTFDKYQTCLAVL